VAGDDAHFFQPGLGDNRFVKGVAMVRWKPVYPGMPVDLRQGDPEGLPFVLAVRLARLLAPMQ